MIAIAEKLGTGFEPRNDVELSQPLLRMARQVKGSTRTTKGLRVKARLAKQPYATEWGSRRQK